jgi:hypothetical protein
MRVALHRFVRHACKMGLEGIGQSWWQRLQPGAVKVGLEPAAAVRSAPTQLHSKRAPDIASSTVDISPSLTSRGVIRVKLRLNWRIIEPTNRTQQLRLCDRADDTTGPACGRSRFRAGGAITRRSSTQITGPSFGRAWDAGGMIGADVRPNWLERGTSPGVPIPASEEVRNDK